MKRKITLSVFILVTGFIYAQTMSGYVSNPSFEDNPTLTDWELSLSNGAVATASIVTNAEDSNVPVSKGQVVKVVISNAGSGNHTDVKLMNTTYAFTDYYSIPVGDVEVNLSWDIKAAAAAEHQMRIVYNKNGGDMANSASVSQKKASASTDWESFAISKTIDAANVDVTKLSFRLDIALAYATGTFYIDNITSSVTDAVNIPTTIDDVDISNIKIWSGAQVIKVENMESATGNISVYDISGREIKNQLLNQGENTIELGLTGLFIVKTLVNGKVLTGKVLVK
ncbi:T9SS type A sorting domain-containing protein [Labilibacter sediminis]|nr:T9SS type A sorting domain-containing protein [Labilibacter sediminis]